MLAKGLPTDNAKLASIAALNLAGKSGWALIVAANELGFDLAAPTGTAPVLQPLYLTSASFVIGTASSGTIGGASTGSTISLSGKYPAGFTINSAARTWAYDGTGAADTGIFTLTETLLGAIGSPKPTSFGWTSTAPVPFLTWTSASNVYDPVFTLASLAVGDVVDLQIATDSGFTSIYGSDTNTVDATEAGDGSLSFPAIPTLGFGTTYYARARKNGGAWSSTVSKTMAAAVVQFPSTTGFNKSQYITVSGSPPLTAAALAGNDKDSVRTNVQQGFNKAQMEITLNSGGASANFNFGWDNGVDDMSGFVLPGYSTSNGLTVNFALGQYIFVNWNAGANQIQFANLAGVIQDNDVFTLVFDKAAHTMECWRTRAGVTTQIGATATGLPALSAYYAHISSVNTAVNLTANFGATAYAKTPGTGVAAQWA
ncbi:hypothetical protein M8312_11925 [Sphingomonas sp. KRR8]|uniref:hypothetical protein n=1 Tax=Sphingomonas sp. KRR8 TaxID=2942996 RepID=UPI00202068D2|nr:hypothetical protein [Sphingomonas sp. KRR8]URD60484.1 hypothetical protein M8312_11925 [Sphingomonas sp. KRR8]